ncbi:hypothetical protein ACHAXR_006448 [Thalassiosira sp. AJA248-18]
MSKQLSDEKIGLTHNGNPSGSSHEAGASPNPLPSLPPIAPQHQSQLIKSLIQENIIKDQIIGLLLSQQQSLVSQLQSMENSSSPASNSESTRPVMMPEAADRDDQPPQNMSNIGDTTIPNLGLNCQVKKTTPGLAAHQQSGPYQMKMKRWNMRYEELKEFQQKHGHCRVPHGYAQNRKLSWWVMNQRAQYQSLQQGKKSWLTPDRVGLLDSLQFDWKPILGKSYNK